MLTSLCLYVWEDSLNDEARELYTVPEAAKEMERPHVTLYRWIEAEKLIAVRLGGILFIPSRVLKKSVV